MIHPSVPTGGSTGICHESTATIDEAAAWLAMQSPRPSPVVPALQKRFGLTAVESCAAIREASLRRARAL